MDIYRPFALYSHKVLSFQPAGGTPLRPSLPAAPEVMLKTVQKSYERKPRRNVVFIGLGSGLTVADAALTLPDAVNIHALEPAPERARAVLNSCDKLQRVLGTSPDRLHILTDSSPWALLLLTAGSGITPENSLCMLNPEVGKTDPGFKDLKHLQQLFAASERRTLPPLPVDSSSLPSLAGGAILRLDEPGLDFFFAGFPAPVSEVVVVWDAHAVPAAAKQHPYAGKNRDIPVRHLARPLDYDFAAQRNFLLSQVDTDLLLMLDGDEILDATAQRLLPGLLAVDDVDGFYIQRRTLYPDEAHCKVGYGLWPDLQLRLFKNSPGLLFERPVHEHLTGFSGRLGILLQGSLLHYNRLRRDDAAVEEKLRMFNAAGCNENLHRLSSEYPSLPLDFFDRLAANDPTAPSNVEYLIPPRQGGSPAEK